uniref:Uncharacterized protein n=1 Tax=Varanus komodoensis TaxID=61221 RepID=A0A8D2Q7X9_VARKO
MPLCKLKVGDLVDNSTASTSTSVPFPCKKQGKRKHRESSNAGESSHLAAEFSEFVDFLADEDVLDSLQSIMEDAVQKLRNVTTEEGEPVFEIQEESCSSPGSESWSISYSSVCSQSSYYTTTLSSDDDWQRWTRSKGSRVMTPKEVQPRREGWFYQRQSTHVMCQRDGILGTCSDGFQAGWRKSPAQLSGELLSHSIASEAPGLGLPEQSFSLESLHKEITNVLKRPTPTSIPLYYPGNQPFQALDFLEENKILAALQDIINQAVCQVLEATGMEFFDEEGHRMPWDSSIGYSDEEEEEEREEGEEEEGEGEGRSGSVSSGSEEETSDEDSKSEGSKTKKKKKKKQKKSKGKKKKKGKVESPSAEEKGKTNRPEVSARGGIEMFNNNNNNNNNNNKQNKPEVLTEQAKSCGCSGGSLATSCWKNRVKCSALKKSCSVKAERKSPG